MIVDSAMVNTRKYKYNPNDYTNILGLEDDLKEFYFLYENYQKEKTQNSLFELEAQSRNLFFTLKHRKVEGAITPMFVEDVLNYLEELLND